MKCLQGGQPCELLGMERLSTLMQEGSLAARERMALAVVM